VAFLTHVII